MVFGSRKSRIKPVYRTVSALITKIESDQINVHTYEEKPEKIDFLPMYNTYYEQGRHEFYFKNKANIEYNQLAVINSIRKDMDNDKKAQDVQKNRYTVYYEFMTDEGIRYTGQYSFPQLKDGISEGATVTVRYNADYPTENYILIQQ